MQKVIDLRELKFSGVSLREKNCIITGASRGIGKAITLELARAGANLCLLGRNQHTLEQVVESAQPVPKKYLTAEVDLSETDQIQQFCWQFAEQFGQVDVLVLNAGVLLTGKQDEVTPEEFDVLYQTNLRAPFELIYRLMPLFNKSFSQVVFINSTVTAGAKYGHYAITKHGLKAMADSLRAEVNEENIRVTSIFAGRTNTQMGEKVFETNGQIDKFNPELLLQPSDIAQAVVHTLQMPLTAEITDIHLRSFKKSY